MRSAQAFRTVTPTFTLWKNVKGELCWTRWPWRRSKHLTYQASGRGVLQVVVFSEQRHDLGEDGFAHQLSFLVFGDDSRPHLDLLADLQLQQETGSEVLSRQKQLMRMTEPHLQDSLQDASSGHASFQIVHLAAGLVHVKRSDDCQKKRKHAHTNAMTGSSKSQPALCSDR